MTVEALSARGVTFDYIPGAPVIDRWTANFPRGTLTAVTGPSGRGKSTLLYLLGLMLQPSAGDITVAGISTSSLRDGARARLRAEHFGFVFQDSALDATRTVLDNVTETSLYRGESKQTSRNYALDLLERFGVDVPPDRKPGQVSGGQAQRIALCRALLHKPAILLADEPTGNLDAETAGIVVSALHAHARGGSTVIVVTHAIEVAAACDREISL